MSHKACLFFLVTVLFNFCTPLQSTPQEEKIETYAFRLADEQLNAMTVFPYRCMGSDQEPDTLRTQKVVIVGASSGIGEAMVKRFAHHGYIIGMCGRKIEQMQVLQAEISTKSFVKQIDLMNIDTVQPLLLELIQEMDGIDLMIVNAGIAPEAQDGVMPENQQIPFDKICDTIKLNVLGCCAAFNVATNYFLRQGYGHIVGISSLDAERGAAIYPGYCASKAFMGRFLEGLRNKFIQANFAINVTEIRPGCIQTANSTGEGSGWYWAVPTEIAAKDIYESILNKEKVAYVPRRWEFISWLLALCPDWFYNFIGGF